jgi:hypothetical protein
VDENPWCFQCSESHWEHECPCNSGDHQQESPQINITAEKQPEAIKSTEEDFNQMKWPTKEEYLQLISGIEVPETVRIVEKVEDNDENPSLTAEDLCSKFPPTALCTIHQGYSRNN